MLKDSDWELLPDYSPKGFALDIFNKRYAHHKDETWEKACERVANHLASCEGENTPTFQTQFKNLLQKNYFMPGGRIWYGAGRPKGQMLNCFVIDTSDSREGWAKTVGDMIIICGTGGGLGLNASPVRPRGTKINGTGGVATGSVSLMEIINEAGEVIKAGGGRRTALMMSLSLDHGDIVEFLDKKLDLKKLNNANVSVIFNENPELFFDKVRNNEDFELKFNGNIVGKISAKDLWNKIISNALNNGEPGVLNGYLANKMSNIYYYDQLETTNPCGEIWLEPYSCCCLGAMVLPRFIHADNGTIQWNLLKEAVGLSVRFLDNVLTTNNYPLQQIEEVCSQSRRIGLGVLGLHDLLLMQGHKYNSPGGLELANKIMEFIKNSAYEASIDLAKEKGSFAKLNIPDFLKSGFVKTLKPSIRSKIKEFGIRNCALLTIAPTGTTSMVCEYTSGIEPMFAPAYRRKYRDTTGELAEEIVVHPLLKEYIKRGNGVDHFQGSHELSMRDHFEMQRICQKHLDNACSKTINVPQGTSAEELSELYMEFLPELKGVTVYPDGSREDQPLTPMPLEEAIKYIKEIDDFEALLSASAGNDSCKDGKCDI